MRLGQDLLSSTEKGGTPAPAEPTGERFPVKEESIFHSPKRLHTTGEVSDAKPSLSGEHSFEGAITRLAGAAEVGTERLLYVRRADVAEVIDALVNHARRPEGLIVPTPTLARLAIVRRSQKKSGKNRRGSLFPPEFLVLEGKRTPPEGHSKSPPVIRQRGDGRRSVSASPSIGMLKSRPSVSPKNNAKAEDWGVTRRIRGGREGEHRRRRKIMVSSLRDPIPSPKVAAALVESSPQKSYSAVSSVSPIETTRDSSCGLSGKITCVAASSRVSGKGAGFEDFWFSGWG